MGSILDKIAEAERKAEIKRQNAEAKKVKEIVDEKMVELDHPLDDMRCMLMKQTEDIIKMLDDMLGKIYGDMIKHLLYNEVPDEKVFQMMKDMMELSRVIIETHGAVEELWDVASDQLMIPYDERHRRTA